MEPLHHGTSTTLVPILDEVTDHQRVMLVGLVVLVTLVHSGVTSPGVEVDDLTGKQFEAALETEENLAVYWCKYFIASLINSRDFQLSSPKSISSQYYSFCISIHITFNIINEILATRRFLGRSSHCGLPGLVIILRSTRDQYFPTQPKFHLTSLSPLPCSHPPFSHYRIPNTHLPPPV